MLASVAMSAQQKAVGQGIKKLGKTEGPGAFVHRLSAFVEHCDVGEYVVEGHLEAYSCKDRRRWILQHGVPFRVCLRKPWLGVSCSLAGKLAGLDKKLSKSLEQDVQIGSSPQQLSASPVGPLSDSNRYAPETTASQHRSHAPTGLQAIPQGLSCV